MGLRNCLFFSARFTFFVWDWVDIPHTFQYNKSENKYKPTKNQITRQSGVIVWTIRTHVSIFPYRFEFIIHTSTGFFHCSLAHFRCNDVKIQPRKYSQFHQLTTLSPFFGYMFR